MTIRPQDLSASARALYDDFRRVGLNEADAMRAARNGYAQERAARVRTARQFSGLSEADERRHLTAIAADVAAQPEITEAAYEVRSAGVFGRLPAAGAVQAVQQEAAAHAAARVVAEAAAKRAVAESTSRRSSTPSGSKTFVTEGGRRRVLLSESSNLGRILSVEGRPVGGR